MTDNQFKIAILAVLLLDSVGASPDAMDRVVKKLTIGQIAALYAINSLIVDEAEERAKGGQDVEDMEASFVVDMLSTLLERYAVEGE